MWNFNNTICFGNADVNGIPNTNWPNLYFSNGGGIHGANVSTTGAVTSNGGRLISQSNGAPSVTAYSVDHDLAYGFWADSNMAFGRMEGNGNPYVYFGGFDIDGNLGVNKNITGGNLYAGNLVQGSKVVSVGGVFEVAPKYYFNRNASDGWWRIYDADIPIFQVQPSGDTWMRGGLFVSQGKLDANFALFGDINNRVVRFRDDGWQIVWAANGNFIFSSPVRTQAYIDFNGNLWVAGTVNGSVISDERTKRDIQPYTRGLEDIVKLNPIMFRFNGEGGTQDTDEQKIGLVAQQVLPYLPECVYPTRDLPVSDVSPSPHIDPRLPDQLSLDDKPLFFAMINALKTIDERLNRLESKGH